MPRLEIDQVAYRATGFGLRRQAPAAVTAEIAFGDRSGRLGVDDEAFWGPLADVPWSTISPGLRDAVLEASLQPLLRWLRAVTGEPVRVTGAPARQAARGGDTLRIAFEPLQAGANAVRRRAYLSLPDEAWSHVAETASRAGVRRNASRLPVMLRIVLEGIWLTRSELTQVKRGDVIRLAGNQAPGGKVQRVTLRLGRAGLFECRVLAAGLRVENASAPDAGRGIMSNDTAVKRLDQLEVPVSFQFGTLSVSLEQLGTIGPGHTFTTPVATEQPVVAILVDGQKVGSGRLIAVGDMVGVQVTDWV